MRSNGRDAARIEILKFGAQMNWPAGLGVLAVLAILLASAAIATGVTALYYDDPIAIGERGGALTRSLRGLVWLLVFQVAVISQTLAAARCFGGEPMRALSLGWPRSAIPTIAAATAALGVFAAAYTAVVLALDRAAVMRDLAPAAELARSDLWLLALAAIGIGAPVAEEVLFRGFLLPVLAKSPLRLAGAMIVTTLAWTALHAGYSVYGLVEVFAVGMFFSWLVVQTGSLWVPILCHAIYNTAIVLALRWLPIPL